MRHLHSLLLGLLSLAGSLLADEAGVGKPAKAAERPQLLADIPLLDLNEKGDVLASELVVDGI